MQGGLKNLNKNLDDPSEKENISSIITDTQAAMMKRLSKMFDPNDKEKMDNIRKQRRRHFNPNNQGAQLQSMIGNLLVEKLNQRQEVSKKGKCSVGVSSLEELTMIRRKASVFALPGQFNFTPLRNSVGISRKGKKLSAINGEDQDVSPEYAKFSKSEVNKQNQMSPFAEFLSNRKISKLLSPIPEKKSFQSFQTSQFTEDLDRTDSNNNNSETVTSGFPLLTANSDILKNLSTRGNRIAGREELILKKKTIQENKQNMNKAYDMYNNIKSSLDSFEEDVQFASKGNKLMNLGKDVVLEKYLQRIGSPAYKKRNSDSFLRKSLNKKNSAKESLKKTPNTPQKAAKKKSVDKQRNSLLDPKKQQHRILSKRLKVEDSLSDDNENFQENLLIYQASNFTIDPQSSFRTYWDNMIIFITFYSLLFTPFYIAFIEDEIYPITIMEVFFDLIFIVDIIINFFVGFYNYEEELVKNLQLIAFNYLTGWFFLDVIASIPGSLIVFILSFEGDITTSQKISVINKATRLSKIYRMIKFTKLFKIVKISKDDQKNVNVLGLEEMNLTSALQRFIKFIVTFLIVSHMITCIWIYLAKFNYPNWLSRNNLLDAGTAELYVASLYFHWVTIFTIGYGDILSSNSLERIYNSLLMFVGILVYSFAVSSLGNIVTNYDSITARYYKNLETLEDLRMKYHIPQTFYEKLAKYLKYDFKFNKNEKYSFINDIPAKLRTELLTEMYKDIVGSFSFLSNCSTEFVSRIVFCMRPMRAFKKEYLVIEGEYLNEVYFNRRGIISVHLGPKYNESKVMEVRKNEHFGDVLVISKTKSPVTLKVASNYVDLLIVRKQDFLHISKEFPEEFEDAILLSTYNFMSMIEIIEKKKKEKIDEENKIKNHGNLMDQDYVETLMNKNNIDGGTMFDVFNDNDADHEYLNHRVSKLENIQVEDKKKSTGKIESTIFPKGNELEIKSKSEDIEVIEEKISECERLETEKIYNEEEKTPINNDANLKSTENENKQNILNQTNHNNSLQNNLTNIVPNSSSFLKIPNQEGASGTTHNMYNFNFIIQNNNFINGNHYNNSLPNQDINFANLSNSLRENENNTNNTYTNIFNFDHILLTNESNKENKNGKSEPNKPTRISSKDDTDITYMAQSNIQQERMFTKNGGDEKSITKKSSKELSYRLKMELLEKRKKSENDENESKILHENKCLDYNKNFTPLDFTKEKANEALLNPQDFFIKEYRNWICNEYKSKSEQHINILNNFIRKVSKKFNLNSNLLETLIS
jgi:hypothetical protein